MISYKGAFERVLKGHDQYRQRRIKRRCIRSRVDDIIDKQYQVKKSQSMKVLLLLRRVLDQMGLERTKMQKRFHNAFLRCSALHIFKDDTEVNLARVMKLFKWDHLKQQVLCMTPRRFGKTTAVAMYCAAYIYCVPNCEICIFSTGRRASQKLLEQIHRLLLKLPNAKERIAKYNNEILNIHNISGSGVSKISSYPSNAKTLR